jgi:LuxR family transcriptional regulator, maltose regulon positive regulatory protein
MQPSLLATKLRIPPQHHAVVHRARLIDAVERNLPRYKLILLSAPAGYGKTTLLAQWAKSSRFPVAWLSLGVQDNDLERFLRYLLAAWSEVQPDVLESTAGLLLGAMTPDSEAVLSALIHVASDLPVPIAFVLDDYHLLEEPAIHQALAFLLEHLPPVLHFVISGRSEPPLPLARYRVRQELLHFGAEDLQFVQEETAEFLREIIGLDQPHGEVEKLHGQLEGWVAGLHLAAISLQQRLPVAGSLTISGRHRFIADYLSQDVLAHLPANLRHFLIQTSILERLCSSLCDAVTGATEGQKMLETLERENMFLVPLDDSRQWYRYHRLFGDFLQAELNRRPPAEITELHRRAARWYADRDLPDDAFRHTIAGNDVELVLQIFDRYVNAKLLGGEFRVLRQWFEALPAEWISAYPVLRIAHAGLLGHTGAFEECIRCINEIEESLLLAESADARWQMARVTSFRCFIACVQNDLPRAENLADQALRDLPEEDLGYRPGIFATLGDAYRRNGRWEEARACYIKVLDFTRSPAFRVRSAHIHGALADLELRQGYLKNAAGYWGQALASILEWENWGRLQLPVTGWVYIRMGELLYEWNELAQARNHLSRGLAHAELGDEVQPLLAGYTIMTRLKLVDGDTGAAAEYLERARPLVQRAPFPEWNGYFQRCQLELWLAQDRLRTAVHWADELLRTPAVAEQLENEAVQLALARILVFKGDMQSNQRAVALLVRLHGAAEAEGRTGILIETLAFQALAQWGRGNRAEAMTALERALRLAAPEGYVRTFVDLGLPMARLLQEAHAREVMGDYVGKLLDTFGNGLSFSSMTEKALPEPLSSREQEVLQLIAAGLTNREIAERLVIAAETVKKHVSNIRDKLGVSNRMQAAARARELDLLN